ncbi:MarR family winged helix-turn-helix transcriptional regulator [Streptomyces sp. NPDC020898]|uniref:MarR family winged helix-turn-helix transcriptional regulator n=1 Tax=Streptomyces sp. NPDC020898 TaxID=3365101 RepID=UPI0037B8333A
MAPAARRISPVCRPIRSHARRWERWGRTKQTAGFLVDQLEKAGYVTREPDPSDRRARLVCLAERVRAAQPVAARVVAEVEAEWEAHLGKCGMAQLRQALTLLREITDPYA